MSSKHAIVFEMIYGDNQWFRMPRALHRIRPNGTKLKEVAYTLAALLNQSSMKKAALRNEGWFQYSTGLGEEDTGFSENKQCLHIKILEDLNLVKRERAKQIHGRRMVKINYDYLYELLVEVSQDDSLLDISRSTPSNIKESIVASATILEEEEERNGTAGRGPYSHSSKPSSKRTINSPTIPQFCFDWQAKLRKILRSKRPVIPISQGSRESWADQFRKLWKKLDEDQDRIDRLLDWYELNINEIDRPTISSAKQFCSDSIFSWLEGLMNPKKKNYSETDKDNRRSSYTDRGDRLQEHEKT